MTNNDLRLYKRTKNDCHLVVTALGSSNHLTPAQTETLLLAQRLYDSLKHVIREQREHDE